VTAAARSDANPAPSDGATAAAGATPAAASRPAVGGIDSSMGGLY
jgi:hypothetical protein